MAISYSDPVFSDVAGRRHVSVDITETSTGPSDEWELDIHEFATVTLVHCVLETAGSASTVDPEIGTATGWSVSSLDHVNGAASAAAAVRIQSRSTVVARGGKLYGRSKPDNTAGTIKTRVAWVEGHDE